MDQLYLATAAAQQQPAAAVLETAGHVMLPLKPEQLAVVRNDNDDASTIDQDISSLVDDNDLAEVLILKGYRHW